jgi:hypothetical protein
MMDERQLKALETEQEADHKHVTEPLRRRNGRLRALTPT